VQSLRKAIENNRVVFQLLQLSIVVQAWLSAIWTEGMLTVNPMEEYQEIHPLQINLVV
jgi:hypothetical protein